MKVLLSWLRDYIEIDHSAQEIAETLSNLGLPYEGIEYLGDDAVIDVEVTSNRGDCLGLIGIARELAAVTGKEVRMPKVEFGESGKPAGEVVSVVIQEPALCPRYTARVIEGVKAGPTPEWMRKRLEAIGMRSVNNVVDATNYAMLETGQPPHAFDYKRILGGKIIVRKAAAGEQIISIDGSKCELTSDMLVIADAKSPVAVAGIMGGLDTEVSEATTTILLEDAFFAPISVRATARKLALPSEASFRFERNVDIENIDWASRRTTQLIIEVAGGKAAKGVVDVYPGKPKPRQATLRLGRLKRVLGIETPADEVMTILARLGFGPKRSGEQISCCVPSWRSDVYREADLIEEVARVYGYARVPAENKITIEVAPLDTRQKIIETIGTYLTGCGFYETVTISFIDAGAAELFTATDNKKHLSVKDVTRTGNNLLRQSVLPSLFGVIKNNHNAGNIPCRLFETADTYIPSQAGKLPNEKTRLALACDGDFRDIRGVVEGLLGSIAPDTTFKFEPTVRQDSPQAEIGWAQSGLRIVAGDSTIGVIGMASQQVLDRFDFKNTTICGAELDLNELIKLRAASTKVKALAQFPAIRRDLSLVVNEEIPWADIESAVQRKAPGELEELQFVDIFRGKGVPEGRKSVTLSLSFRDADGTLTHEEVDSFEKTILAELTTSLGAALRTA
ncbi:MAG: phenylalanine--tRNA ligase subunit beta [Sedimentisphaerales bacterium]|nr:phenylalanine--tRNA ligase subunit beta [Sedimentisphaerales bacterium]